jgi:hypothetical protein
MHAALLIWFPRWRFAAALGVFALFLGSGCATTGAAGAGVRPSSPFTPEDGHLFEDGVDLVGNPEALSGKWAEDWSNEMRDRVVRSDFIARVTVNTLRSDVDPQQHTTHWLISNVDEVLTGKLSTRELAFASSDETPGFGGIERERDNILHRPMLVLGKWAELENGEVRPHWHMALASNQVVAVVKQLLQESSRLASPAKP